MGINVLATQSHTKYNKMGISKINSTSKAVFKDSCLRILSKVWSTLVFPLTMAFKLKVKLIFVKRKLTL